MLYHWLKKEPSQLKHSVTIIPKNLCVVKGQMMVK